MKCKFESYDKVRPAQLQKSAADIKQLSVVELNKAIAEHLREYFKSDISEEGIFNFEIETTSVNGIEDAAMLVKYTEYPLLIPGELQINGMARLVKMNKDNLKSDVIPAIFLFRGDESFDSLDHEKIHICQYLLDSHYPLSEEEFDLFSSKELDDAAVHVLESSGEEKALQYAIHAVCFKFWMEAEAVFHSQEKQYYEWLEHVYRTSMPIACFEGLRELLGWENDSWNTVRKRFSQFCSEMQTEVDWIRTMLIGRALHDEIVVAHNEWETEMLFGPIDENDLDHDEEYEARMNIFLES